MADRAKGIGAEFSLQSQPGEGTWIEIVWRNRSSEPDADKP
jgi:signal transduction histidine kinase